MRHFAFWTRAVLLTSAGVALPTLFACLDHPLKPVELQREQEEEEGIALSINKDVDILFVIDNSGSMGEEQASVSANFDDFIEVLERPGVEANYRIGVTTTDNGNPLCPTSTPEGGNLRAISCVDRQGEFIFGSGTNQIDATQAACLDFCDQSVPIEGDVPWIESIEGVTNVPIGTVEAFQCIGPQGINGCGMESHLESMYRFFQRAGSPTEDEHGFLRDGAILSIVFITDEADCSHNDAYRSIFEQDGERTFWEDQTAAQATSAVCWNAGVTCSGGPGTYTECHSENKNTAGAEGVPGDQAVLYPVSRYINYIDGIEQNKRQYDSDAEVLVAVIGGVPSGYHLGSAEIQYADATDPDDQNSFGIGFGCISATGGNAVPPVRLREFAEHYEVGGDRNLFSICDGDFGPALEAIAEKIVDQVKPACMPRCVADTDETTEVVDPLCQLEQRTPTGGEGDGPIQECVYLCGGQTSPDCNRTNADAGEGGWQFPDGQNVCFHMLTDTNGSTPSPHDDMGDDCADGGYNLEFKLERSGGAPPGTRVSATCTLSDFQSIDCPLLGT